MNVFSWKHVKWLGAGITGLLLGALPAMAAEGDISFAGFATLAYGKTLTDDKKEGTLPGFSDEGEYRDFNKLGFRMDADLKDNLTFTAQILVQGTENYDPSFDWIFATYQLHPEWAISVGRIRVPIYMYSDYLDTSYAFQWIEPPKSVYNFSQTPFNSIEGIKLAYNTSMGDWTSEWLLWFGKGEDKFTETGTELDLTLEDAAGTAWTVGYDWLSMRAFYFEANSSINLDDEPTLAPLLSGLDALQTALSISTGKQYNFLEPVEWQRDSGRFFGLGTAMDFEKFFISAEATRIDISGDDSNFVAPLMDSYYITAGVRLPGQVTLSLTYGVDKDYPEENVYKLFQLPGVQAEISALSTALPFIDSQLALLPQTPEVVAQRTGIQQLIAATPDLQALAAGMRANVEAQQDFRSQNTTLSLRWDFHRSASAKFEYLYENREGDNAKARGLDQPQAVRVGLDLVF